MQLVPLYLPLPMTWRLTSKQFLLISGNFDALRRVPLELIRTQVLAIAEARL